MSSQNEIITVLDEPVVERNIYRFLMHRKDPNPVEESLREMEVIENTPMEIVIS